MKYALTCKHCCKDRTKKYCLVKGIVEGVATIMIPVYVIECDSKLDVALLCREGEAVFDCTGIKVCPTLFFPKHEARNNVFELYYYNVFDFLEGNDRKLVCQAVRPIIPKLIDDENIKLSIILNTGASGAPIVYVNEWQKTLTLVALYTSYNKVSYSCEDALAHIESKIVEGKEDLTQDIPEMDLLSLAMSKTSSHDEHSSYGDIPMKCKSIMAFIDFKIGTSHK